MKVVFVLYALFLIAISTLYNWTTTDFSGTRSSSGSSWSSTRSGGSWGGGGGHK
ncbi:hypothetical protein [Herbaspirillum sp. B65]|uniref:hypothetical protein n=1 Tax=Herbaspirillum sp. B65 TaxID=137708 RepID=UPI00034845B3|nr:hypothetical protein [Herbaspirillum sp. B65]